MIKSWPTLSSKHLGDYRIFQIRSDLKQSPLTGQSHDFYVIDTVNWVNVVALTPEQQMIMIEQYRHGSDTVELEIPGGMIDAEDTSPAEAGVRELCEETGYEGDSAEIIGQVFPNPAIMNNICYTLLLRNCQLKHATKFDSSEDILTRLVPATDVPSLVASGRIRHSLVVAALYHFQLWRDRENAR